jgi:hypothetical protein
MVGFVTLHHAQPWQIADRIYKINRIVLHHNLVNPVNPVSFLGQCRVMKLNET